MSGSAGVRYRSVRPTSVTPLEWAEAETRRRNVATASWLADMKQRDPALYPLARLAITRVEVREVVAWAAAEHGWWCALCAADLGDGPVVRRRVPFAGRVVPICMTCGSTDLAEETGRCSCGRAVRYGSRRPDPEPLGRRMRVFCCDDHRREQVNADRRAVRNAGCVARCGACQTQFSAGRSDAEYCSGACRQAAYRRRIADRR